MKRTKRQSLERCKKLWECLAEFGFRHKSEAYKKLNFKINSDIYDCPACEYSETHSGNYCNENCIISWPGIKEDYDVLCQLRQSPFGKWRYELYLEKRKKYARQIVKLCNEALAKL